jgi:hypothetical protein
VANLFLRLFATLTTLFSVIGEKNIDLLQPLIQTGGTQLTGYYLIFYSSIFLLALHKSVQ